MHTSVGDNDFRNLHLIFLIPAIKRPVVREGGERTQRSELLYFFVFVLEEVKGGANEDPGRTDAQDSPMRAHHFFFL